LTVTKPENKNVAMKRINMFCRRSKLNGHMAHTSELKSLTCLRKRRLPGSSITSPYNTHENDAVRSFIRHRWQYFLYSHPRWSTRPMFHTMTMLRHTSKAIKEYPRQIWWKRCFSEVAVFCSLLTWILSRPPLMRQWHSCCDSPSIGDQVIVRGELRCSILMRGWSERCPCVRLLLCMILSGSDL